MLFSVARKELPLTGASRPRLTTLRNRLGPESLPCPYRLVGQDTSLSSWRHGFESRWGYHDSSLLPSPRAVFLSSQNQPSTFGLRCDRQWRSLLSSEQQLVAEPNLGSEHPGDGGRPNAEGLLAQRSRQDAGENQEQKGEPGFGPAGESTEDLVTLQP